ncbi:hypothetical protein [Thalassobius sp. MITS945101]|uniref:hypothetical protein n=1 Tax=Thalassobius sp. MITS945101 TaxID=3096994 RepID=UPI00399B9555
MKQIALIVLPAFLLSACGQVPLFDNLSDRPWLKPAPASSAETAETLPESDDIEVAALPAPDPDAPRPEPTASGFLGTTVASLGDATKEGFWLETPLVDAPAKGNVRYPASGREVKVDLIPRSGAVSAGSSLSLGAMRLLDAPITGLPEIEVFQL